jgi:uncharacterized protein (DUF1330 family)
MSAYFIVSYRVTNDEGYQKYLQAAGGSIAQYGGEVLVVDRASEPVEGSPPPVTVVIRFESKEGFRGWYESPEYQAAVHYRLDNSEGSSVIVDGLPSSA